MGEVDCVEGVECMVMINSETLASGSGRSLKVRERDITAPERIYLRVASLFTSLFASLLTSLRSTPQLADLGS